MKLHFMSNELYNGNYTDAKLRKLASHLFRQKWLDAGVPALSDFYTNHLSESDKRLCHRVLHEVLKA